MKKKKFHFCILYNKISLKKKLSKQQHEDSKLLCAKFIIFTINLLSWQRTNNASLLCCWTKSKTLIIWIFLIKLFSKKKKKMKGKEINENSTIEKSQRSNKKRSVQTRGYRFKNHISRVLCALSQNELLFPDTTCRHFCTTTNFLGILEKNFIMQKPFFAALRNNTTTA